MADTLRICLAQLNLVVGDVAGNTARIAASIRQAREERAADLVVFQELAFHLEMFEVSVAVACPVNDVEDL